MKRAACWCVVIGWMAAASALGAEPTAAGAEAKSPGAAMDYGPVFSSSLAAGTGAQRRVLAYKSLTIKVGEGAYVSFDTDLMRYAAGWTGGWLDLSKTHMTGPKGSQCPDVAGKIVFSTKMGPGVSRKGSLADSRTEAGRAGVGPLPKGHAHYRGMYVSSAGVSVIYSAGGGFVSETPGMIRGGDVVSFTRQLQVDTTTEALTIVLADEADGLSAALFEAPAGAKVVRAGHALHLSLPAIAERATFTVVLSPGAGTADAVVKAMPPTPPFIDERPPPQPLWSQAIETEGQLGKPAAADGADFPYVVDTLTLPVDNPWSSWMRLTGLDFFADGKSAAVCTWNGDVWIVSGIDDKLGKLTWKRFATGLYEPLGLKIVDGVVYVIGRDQITRLVDSGGDGEADFYENFNNDAPAGDKYHLFKFGLDTDAAGNFYYSACGAWVENDLFPTHGCVTRVSADGSRSEVIARGLRAPNGLAVGPAGEVVTSDNQGNWTPTSRINLIPAGKADGFYGFVFDPRYEKTFDVKRAYPNGRPEAYDPPLCWVPYAWDHSSGGQAFVTTDKWGPFKGNIVHTSYADARLFMVMGETVGGVPQGGLWRFPFVFDSGAMRPRFNPADGQLYVAGLRAWQANAARDGCLQRVRYTGGPVHQPASMRATAKGVSITFAAPLDPASANDAGAWDVEQWNYRWSSAYGSAEYSVENPSKKGRDTVEVRSAKLGVDGRTVFLEMPGIRPVMQMGITYKVKGADGRGVEGVVYGTVNRL